VCARAVRSTFYDLFSKGLIYRGKRLVNWDTYLQTTVSDDEVFTETVEGNFWHFRYPIIDPKPGEPTHVVVATTRPETMLGDTAVAVHPDPAGALAKAIELAQHKLAEAAAKDQEAVSAQIEVLKQRQVELLPELEKLADMARDGRKIRLPLTGREIPLVVDSWAKPELGSGCVKITPAHDPNDYEVAQRCSLPMINIMNVDGTINAQGGRFQDLTMPKAREQVVAAIDSLWLLEKTEDRQIELKHSDRTLERTHGSTDEGTVRLLGLGPEYTCEPVVSKVKEESEKKVTLKVVAVPKADGTPTAAWAGPISIEVETQGRGEKKLANATTTKQPYLWLRIAP
jgi:valyl-tRNA synthetase